MKKTILEFNYTSNSCFLVISENGKIREVHGDLYIPGKLEYHVLGHAIRQLLVDKYGFDLPCVYKPLSTKAFEVAKISGLHI